MEHRRTNPQPSPPTFLVHTHLHQRNPTGLLVHLQSQIHTYRYIYIHLDWYLYINIYTCTWDTCRYTWRDCQNADGHFPAEVALHLRVYDMTHSYVCHQLFACVPLHVHICNMTHSCVSYDFSTSVWQGPCMHPVYIGSMNHFRWKGVRR